MVGVVAAVILGMTKGLPAAILALAAGVLLGAIMLFWESLRVLVGEAPLPDNLESFNGSAQGIDILTSRKKMLVVSLKDLERERALGKLEVEDYTQLSLSYREELKVILRRIDQDLEPYREKAEEAIRAHLERRGLLGKERAASSSRQETEEVVLQEERVLCKECGTSNEMDAHFCKGCGAELASSSSKETEPSC